MLIRNFYGDLMILFFVQCRNYSENQQPKNFFQKFFEQVQDDLKKNKEIKVNLSIKLSLILKVLKDMNCQLSS